MDGILFVEQRPSERLGIRRLWARIPPSAVLLLAIPSFFGLFSSVRPEKNIFVVIKIQTRFVGVDVEDADH